MVLLGEPSGVGVSGTRREWLQMMAALSAGAVTDALIPRWVLSQQPARLAAFRAQIGAVPIQAQQLGENLTLLSGPGGNVVVLHGADGLIVVDTFVAPAWPRLEESLKGLGTPVKFVINTHWHFDHTDNNAPLHAGGATVVAHENTKRRMSEPQHIAILDLDFPPSPAAALPQRVFKDGYPVIDGSTGGRVDGMSEACDRLLRVADAETKIVPGHGPLATRADLVKYRDMLATAADRVRKLKASGKSLEESIAAKPFTDLDGDWGTGRYKGDDFVKIVYLTL